MCVTVNFLVCVLCLQALVVPPSVKLSALFLTPGARWRGGSHAGLPDQRRAEAELKPAYGAEHTVTITLSKKAPPPTC
ncbi:hypothetical protein ACER0C_009785 [Sarotherodon galilaeus]